MSLVTLQIKNAVTRIAAPPLVMKGVSDLLSFDVPNSHFAMRRLPPGAWDGRKRLMKKDGSFPAGLTAAVLGYLKEQGISDYKIEDLRVKPEPSLTFKLRADLRPRPHQSEWKAITDERVRGVGVVGTGGGKSIMQAMTIHARRVPTLVVVPDKGLKEQLTDDFAYWLDAKHGVIGGDLKGDYPVVVVNIHQIPRAKPEQLQRFHMLMIDEFHHCCEKNTQISDAYGTYRSIEEVYDRFMAGERRTRVKSWTGVAWESKRVVNAFRYPAPPMKRVRVQDEDGKIREITVTANHEIFTALGKIKAGELVPGDQIILGYTPRIDAMRHRSANRSYREHLSKRAAKNNTNRSPEVRAGQAAKLREKMARGEYNPYGRGQFGNGGELTPTQRACLALWPDAIAEHVVALKDGQRPYHYKIDVAFVKDKIAVEIDGTSHKRRQAADERKNKRLEVLGWRIVRIPEGSSVAPLFPSKTLSQTASTSTT